MIREGVELLGSQGINEDVQTSETDSTSEGDVPQSKRRKLSSWLKEATQVVSTSVRPQTAEQKVNSQVEDYLKCNIIDPETNPLKWWSAHEVDFPVISKLAKNTRAYVLVVHHLKESSVCQVTLCQRREML